MKKLMRLVCMIVSGSVLAGCALQQGMLDEKQAELEAKSKPPVVATTTPASTSTSTTIAPIPKPLPQPKTTVRRWRQQQ